MSMLTLHKRDLGFWHLPYHPGESVHMCGLARAVAVRLHKELL